MAAAHPLLTSPTGHVAPHPARGTSARPRSTTLGALTLGALGIVFGDIGTSPLYTLKECVATAGGADATRADVLGILSLVAWALTLVVTVKYLAFIMRADNHGEGGIFALLAIVPERLRAPTPSGRAPFLAVLVVIGAALLYGDGAITPAISVLSATEGLGVARPELARFSVPLTVAILVGLFAFQARGTGAIGRLFGPVMLLWFATIGLLGLWHLADAPEVLLALSPHHAVGYFARHGLRGALVLGSVVLAVTGGEALYADMGHFGARPIRVAWLAVVMPSLLLCYFGQGAHLLRDPSAMASPFFAMVPRGVATYALVGLASTATVIASQALISGAFSLTRQAVQLGYFPRVTVRHTARETEGQIYVPQMNALLAAGCLALVLAFRTSDRLASAYGIAVTGTMAITSVVFFFVTREHWRWPLWRAAGLSAIFLAFDLPFFGANLFKLADGGYVPVLVAVAFIAAMLLWNRGRTLTIAEYNARHASFEEARAEIERAVVARVPGLGVFLASSETQVPPALVHHVIRGRSLHETVVLFTIVPLAAPTARDAGVERCAWEPLGLGIFRLVAAYGYTERVDVHETMQRIVEERGIACAARDITYYLGRLHFVASDAGRMGRIAESVYAFLRRNSVSADESFGVPPEQAVEIGVQIDL